MWIFFLTFVFLAQAIIFFGHWVIYKTLISFWGPIPGTGLFWLRLIFIVLGISFLAASSLASRYSSQLWDRVYTAAAAWFGTVHFLVLGSICFWTAVFIANRFEYPIHLRPLGIGIFLVAFILSAYGIYNSFRPRIVSYDVEIKNLPPSWHGRKIVMFADTHFGNVRGVSHAEELAQTVQMLQPDLLVVPGDFFDGPPADYEKIAAAFSGAGGTLGKYFSEGNHEEFRDPENYLPALRKAGFKILGNASEVVDGLQVIGVKYSNSNTVKDLEKTLAEIKYDRNKPSLLLKHAPFVPEVAARAGISLMFSGHSHSGQVWPFNLVAKMVYGTAAYGKYVRSGMIGITTSGYGTWGPPQRVGTRGEIVVVNLK